MHFKNFKFTIFLLLFLTFSPLPQLTLLATAGKNVQLANFGSLDQSNVDALLAIYNATNGTDWLNVWDLAGDPNDWYGVVWYEGEVWGLNLAFNNLIGVIPNEISNLKNLRTLNLSFNSLSGEIPESIYDLTYLESLFLNSNVLEGRITGSVGQLINLKSLFVSNNLIEGQLPEEIKNLVLLEELEVNSNKLSGKIPSEIGEISTIKYLNLGDNDFSGKLPSELGGLNHLKELYLFDNNLSGSLPPEMTNLDSIEVLHLHNNKISGSIPSTVSNMEFIKYLDLHENLLTGSVPEGIGDLANLEGLYLQQNQLKNNVPNSISSLEKLVNLNLSFNDFAGELPNEISQLPALKNLAVNDLNLEELPDFSNLNLNELNISNNKFTFEDMEPNYASITTNTGQQPFGDLLEIEALSGEDTTFQFSIGGEFNSYQWTKDGEPLEGRTDSILILQNISSEDEGIYQLLVENNLVTDIVLESETIELTVFSEEKAPTVITDLVDEILKKENIWTYPNPVTREVNIISEVLNWDDAQVFVFDVKGAQVPFILEKTNNKEVKLVFLDDVKGTLIVKIFGNDQTVQAKIVRN